MARGEHLKMSEADRKRLSELSKKYIAEAKAGGKTGREAASAGLARARREVKGKSEVKKEKSFLEKLFS